MSSGLSELIKSLKQSREGVLPSIQAFPPLDLEQISSTLRLDARAVEQGGQNQPATGSESMDGTEGAIQAEIERRARKATEDYRSQIGLYDGRIQRAIGSTDQRASVEAAGENALTDFKVRTVDDLNHLNNARHEVEGREQEFEAFRSRHRLTRLPAAISPHQKSVRWLVLAILVLLESTLNGIFFAEGSETGLIGGVTLALVLSFLNVGAAVLCARFFLPCVLHVRPAIKAVGVGGTVLYVAWAIGLNLIVGHFRDLFVRYAGHVAMTDIVSRLSSAPLVLDDVMSWLLVLLGIGLSVVSLVDARGIGDPYLGYGAIGRQRAQAVSEYADAKTRCLDGLTQLRDVAIEEMSEVIEFMRATEHELRLAVQGRKRLHENYCAFLQHLADSHEQLMQRYWEVNTRSRATPTPRRFNHRPSAPDFLAPPVLSELEALGQDARAHVVERMGHFIKAINLEFEAAVRRFQTVDELMKRQVPPRVDS